MLEIKNKIEFENKCWIGEVNSSLFNSSEESRINAVTDMASITKGKLGFELTGTDCTLMIAERKAREDVARKRLYNRLLTEAAGNLSVSFEFVPILDSYKFKDIAHSGLYNLTYKYCTLDKYGNYFTNLRNIPNIKLYNRANEVGDFKIIIGKVPWMVIKYLGRKSAFSLICELDNAVEEDYIRYLNEIEFWYPSWWNPVFEDAMENIDTLLLQRVNADVTSKYLKPEEATMELSDRRLVTFAMAAWKQDTNAWDNLFAVRRNNTGTMDIIEKTVNIIEQLIK